MVFRGYIDDYVFRRASTLLIQVESHGAAMVAGRIFVDAVSSRNDVTRRQVTCSAREAVWSVSQDTTRQTQDTEYRKQDQPDGGGS